MREGGEGREQLIAVFQRDQQVCLVALAIIVEAGITCRRGQFRKAEISCQLKREQLVRDLVRLFDALGQFILAGVERVAPAGALAAINVRLLIVIGCRTIEPVERLPARSKAPRHGPFTIRVGDAAQIRSHVRRIGKIRIRVRHADFLNDIRIIDEAGIVFKVDRTSDGKVWRQSLVEGKACLIAEGCGLGILRDFRAHFEKITAEIRLVRNVANRAAQRTRTIECALWPKQNFDTLHVVQLQVHEQRNFANIGCDRAAAIIVAIAGAEAIRIQAAHDQRVALTAPAIHHVDTGHVGQHIGQFVEALLLDLFAANRCNVQRNVLNAFGAASCRYSDCLRAQFAVA